MDNMSKPIVTVDNLHKRYGTIAALKGIAFRIFQGDFFGLIGPNGSGKTTLIGILTGVIEPTGGAVLINGRDFQADPLRAKARLGFVPQSLALYPSLRVRDNLSFFAGLYGLRGQKLRERLEAALEAVGLRDQAERTVAELSHGMQRRLNIASGLVHEPEILILDEPTAGLDTRSRDAVLDVLECLNRSGLTLLYSTHYIEEAERLCNRVGILNRGELAALDTPDRLVRQFGTGLVLVEFKASPDDALLRRMDRLGSIRASDARNRQFRIETKHPEDAARDLFLLDKRGDLFKRIEIIQPDLESVLARFADRLSS